MAVDELSLEHLPSRYVVGIDLGTTNSAVTYVDTAEEPWQVRTFAIRQIVSPGQVEARDTLPSFHYQPAAGEFTAGALRLPWNPQEPDHVVGFFARDHGALVPGRLIASAKSWLCHGGVDRTAELLPWHGAEDVTRLSPVQASARYLAHLRAAWDAQFPGEPLDKQDLVLTLPASFDEIARELTVAAAAQAGLPRVVLIEEPQAAFYAWIYKHQADWESRVSPGQKILVCDIGGGTSDFTLIRVRPGEETDGAAGRVQFHRVAVGEHLILGGDNFDLALARHVEERLVPGGSLEPRQWDVLVRNCRSVKETLLGAEPPPRLTVNVPGTGSRLIGGGLQLEVTREEIRQLLVEGFFPLVDLADRPQARQSGFQEFGLPYAPDAAVTRYLAAFLCSHREETLDRDAKQAASQAVADHDPARPDILLFNGGVFDSPDLRQRLVDALGRWFRTPRNPQWQPQVLDNDRLDLAVARGAAYYGMVRRGQGVRISAGLARTYYIGVAGPEPSAVCLVPAGTEPGHDVDLSSRQFELLVSQPVEFPLYVSSTRLTDSPGELVAVDRERMTSLPPIRTVLRTRKKGDPRSVSVELHARLTEIGTLDLWCSEIGTERSWRLQFDVRSATETDVAAHQGAGEQQGFVDEQTWDRCRGLLVETFGPGGQGKPEGLMKRLAAEMDLARDKWPPSLLRRIWETLIELQDGRRRSQTHEARWINLLGFALRPGYGLAVDDWRVAETWRLVYGKLAFAAVACRAEAWILWRRIAGGMSAGPQRSLAEPLLAHVRNLHKQLTTGKGRGGDFEFGSHEGAEVFRLLGSLELLAAGTKVELGDMLLDLLSKPKLQPVRSALVWALGRIGARVPAYGPLNTAVSTEVVGRWLDRLLREPTDDPMQQLTLMQLARRTGDRHRDVGEKLRQRVVAELEAAGASPHLIALVAQGGALDADEQGRVFGESLPAGLRIQ